MAFNICRERFGRKCVIKQKMKANIDVWHGVMAGCNQQHNVPFKYCQEQRIDVLPGAFQIKLLYGQGNLVCYKETSVDIAVFWIQSMHVVCWNKLRATLRRKWTWINRTNLKYTEPVSERLAVPNKRSWNWTYPLLIKNICWQYGSSEREQCVLNCTSSLPRFQVLDITLCWVSEQ